MHSRTGFSGSPVFGYRTFGTDLTGGERIQIQDFEIINLETFGTAAERYQNVRARRAQFKSPTLFRFLGIHWGQFIEKWELRNRSLLSESKQKHLIADGTYIEGMSGMTCVVPAWRVWEVIEMAKAKNPRSGKSDDGDEKIKVESVPRATDENPNHREDFTRLVGAAARKPPQED
jgi:hypothetical protein